MKHLIIFYDEPCIFCNYWVQRLCRWDKRDQLRFSPLDHPRFEKFAKERNLNRDDMDTVVAWDQEYCYGIEAQAAFMVLKCLGGFWKLLSIFSLLPDAICNGLYRFIAKNRYKWFGKYDQCPLPNTRYAHKFLN